MLTTSDIETIATAFNHQRGLEPYQESRQALNRAIWALGKALHVIDAQKLLDACGLLPEAERLAFVEGVGTCLTVERPAFPGIQCPKCGGDVVLIEQGHERQWSLDEEDSVDVHGNPTTITACFSGLEDYSDDGDGEYFTRCGTCLAEFDAPADEWDWN